MFTTQTMQLFALNVGIASTLCALFGLGLSFVFRSLPKRYSILASGLVACLLCPLAVSLGMQWSLGRLPSVASTVAERSEPAVAAALPHAEKSVRASTQEMTSGETAPEVEQLRLEQPPLIVPHEETILAASQNPAALASTTVIQVDSTWTKQLGLGLLWLWLAGCSLMLAHQLKKLWSCRVFLRACRPIEGVQLPQIFARVKRSLNLRQTVDFLESDSLATPIVLAWRRPTIVLPADILFSLSTNQLHSVLAHELAHIRRQDHWMVALESLARILYWWNPLVHRMSHQLNHLREMICDDIVTTLTEQPDDYARSIIQIAERTAICPVYVSSLGIGLSPIGELERRVKRILAGRSYRVDLGITKRFALGLTALSSILIAGLLFAQVPPAKTDKPGSESNAEPIAQSNPPADETALAKPTTAAKLGKADQPLKHFTGNVLDEDGKPVPGAKVHALFGRAEIDTSVSADDAGTFQLSLRLQSELTQQLQLSARSPDGTKLGYYQPWQSEPTAPAKPFEIRIDSVRTARIQVVDGSGKPIESAQVAIEIGFPVVLGPTLTDSAGKVAFDVPKSARIGKVVALKDFQGLDYRAYQLPISQDADLNAKVPEFPFDSGETLTLAGASPLKVHVTGQGSAPVKDVDLHVWLLQRKADDVELNFSYFNELFHEQTDGNGNASFAWFPKWQEQPTVVWPSAKGFDRLRAVYDPAIQAGKIDIKLNPLIPLRGRVTFPDGKAAADITVMAVGAGYADDSFRDTTTTDASGRYEFLVSQHQIYMVSIQDKQWSAPSQSGFAALPDQPIDEHNFQVRPATRLYGKVLNKTTNQPVAKQLLYLTEYGMDLHSMNKDLLPNPSGSSRWVCPIKQLNLESDEQGGFEFMVGDGNYNLFIQGKDAQKFTINGETEKQVDLVVDIKPQMEFVGKTVSDESGEVLEGIKIEGVSKNLREFNDWRASSDEQGVFKVQRRAEAHIMHAVNAERTLGAIANISATDKSVEMRLQPLGSAKGRLLKEDGSGPASLTKLYYGVPFTDPDSQMSTTRFGPVITTDKDGHFSMPNLVPGWDYYCTLLDYPGGYVITVAKVKVEKGQSLDLGDVKIPPGPKPYVPPTLESRTQESFDVAGTPIERFAKAKKQIELVNQNLLIVFGQPTGARIRELMKIRFEDEDFGPYRDDFRFMAIPTDGARLAAAQELAKKLNLELKEGREDFHLVLLNKAGEIVASAGAKELSSGDPLSKDALFGWLDPFRTKPLDAQTLLDEALKKAVAENKRVIVQETATWCWPCHQLTRLLLENRQWEQDYIWVKMDHRWTGAQAIMEKMRNGAAGGIPWFAILDASGKILATSNLPGSGENIGFPSEASGQEHFANMLKATRKKMTDDAIAKLIAAAAAQQ